MDCLLIIDMQQGMLAGDPKHELDTVVARINSLKARMRSRGDAIYFIQHDGTPDDAFEALTPGWQLLDELDARAEDRVVRKTLNDAFAGTELASLLRAAAPERVVIAGWATDFCVDATVRSAVSHGFHVSVAADCHTLADRPHLSAEKIIEHHGWVWANLTTPHPVRVVPECEI